MHVIHWIWLTWQACQMLSYFHLIFAIFIQMQKCYPSYDFKILQILNFIDIHPLLYDTLCSPSIMSLWRRKYNVIHPQDSWDIKTQYISALKITCHFFKLDNASTCLSWKYSYLLYIMHCLICLYCRKCQQLRKKLRRWYVLTIIVCWIFIYTYLELLKLLIYAICKHALLLVLTQLWLTKFCISTVFQILNKIIEISAFCNFFVNV